MSNSEQHVLLLEQPSALSEKREDSPSANRRLRDASPKRAEKQPTRGDVDWDAPEFSAPLSQPVPQRRQLPALYETWTPRAQYLVQQPSDMAFRLLGRYYDLLQLRNKAYQLGLSLVATLRERWPTYRQLQSGLSCFDAATLNRISEACDLDAAQEQQRRLQELQRHTSTNLLCDEEFSSFQ